MKQYIHTKEFYNEFPSVYDAVSDYFSDHNLVKLAGMEPEPTIEARQDDCYMEDGNFYMPVAYEWTYKGTNEFDDRDEYKPLYLGTPTLTKDEVDALVKEYELEPKAI